MAMVRVYVVTYRRPHLLERALRSLTGQTWPDWVADVHNDDPEDDRVAGLIDRIGDPRIRLSTPCRHRGGTANFNHAFRTVEEPYAAILEDDNWWEPGFLKTILEALRTRHDVVLAVGNERLWQEQADGSWIDLDRTIWPASDDVEEFPADPLHKCGGATICNSSMLFRTRGAEAYRTPDSIPIDVTEHFRERVIPHPVLLVKSPLVNYGATLRTHRTQGNETWAQLQVLLIGSVFALVSANGREPLARSLWERTRQVSPLSRNALLATGLFVPGARPLWRSGTFAEKCRFLLTCLRRPATLRKARRAIADHAEAWQFLQRGWFAESMREQAR